MRVRVEYYAQAREAAGTSAEVVELPGPCTAQALAVRLAQERGGRLARLLLGPDGTLSPGLLLAVGDRQVRPDEPLELREGDEVVIIPPVSGG